MNNTNTWMIQTRETLDKINKKIEEIKTEAEKKIALYQHKKSSFEEAMKTYLEMNEEPQSGKKFNSKRFEGKTQEEMICLIAQQNDGIIIAKDAIKFIKKEKLFGGKTIYTGSAVYAILRRSKYFIKVREGVYKLDDSYKSKTKKSEKSNSIKEIVKSLKESDPYMSKEEIKNKLLQEGFDFKGKNPKRIVNMAWIHLGYSKKENDIEQALRTLHKQGQE